MTAERIHFKTYNKAGLEAYLCNTNNTKKEENMTDELNKVTCKNCRLILGVLLE